MQAVDSIMLAMLCTSSDLDFFVFSWVDFRVIQVSYVEQQLKEF